MNLSISIYNIYVDQTLQDTWPVWFALPCWVSRLSCNLSGTCEKKRILSQKTSGMWSVVYNSKQTVQRNFDVFRWNKISMFFLCFCTIDVCNCLTQMLTMLTQIVEISTGPLGPLADEENHGRPFFQWIGWRDTSMGTHGFHPNKKELSCRLWGGPLHGWGAFT